MGKIRGEFVPIFLTIETDMWKWLLKKKKKILFSVRKIEFG